VVMTDFPKMVSDVTTPHRRLHASLLYATPLTEAVNGKGDVEDGISWQALALAWGSQSRRAKSCDCAVDVLLCSSGGLYFAVRS
jgi:hypothetical protein